MRAWNEVRLPPLILCTKAKEKAHYSIKLHIGYNGEQAQHTQRTELA